MASRPGSRGGGLLIERRPGEHLDFVGPGGEACRLTLVSSSGACAVLRLVAPRSITALRDELAPAARTLAALERYRVLVAALVAAHREASRAGVGPELAAMLELEAWARADASTPGPARPTA